ncbi:hypothetical protein ZTR_07518 [Talaromyces verruculosus]|nr:hypothetical protein ZTR_07518 [Talaromyces verruculosus]
MYLLMILALALYHITSSVFAFLNNLDAAKKIGLPIVISPVSRTNPAWMIFQKHLVPLLTKLPFGLGSFTRYNTMSWWFTEKHRIHQQYDPFVNQQIFSRRREFEKPSNLLKTTKIYGDNVTTVTGPDWQRHRRITTSPFNERNNKLVWNEAIRQTIQVGAYWCDHGSAGFETATQDWSTVTLNILATAAFGESWDFRGMSNGQQSESNAGSKMKMTYRDSLFTLASNIRMLVLTPTWLYSVPLSWLPNGLQQFASAYKQFEQHMKQMVRKKKEQIARGEAVDATLLSTLILKSEESRLDQLSGSPTRNGTVTSVGAASVGLSDEELYGNLFIYNVAGHETTSSTLGFAMYLLATFPNWQNWVFEELDLIYGPHSNTNDLVYEEVYPRLKRCLAIMLETLRLYCPIHTVFKATSGAHGEDLIIDGQTVHIPPNTYVLPNFIASHTLPEFWGDDHLDWNPSRWIESASTSLERNLSDKHVSSKPGGEEIRTPPKGKDTYFPWSGGGRVCPGKKFSQVEFVAAISVLLWEYVIEVVPRPGRETVQQARQRCLDVIQDSESFFTLQMKNPTSVRLRLIKRQH